MNVKDIAIIGAGGFGLEVAQLIGQINGVAPLWRLIGFFDDGKAPGTLVDGLPVIGDVASINRQRGSTALICPISWATSKPNPPAPMMAISRSLTCHPVL